MPSPLDDFQELYERAAARQAVETNEQQNTAMTSEKKKIDREHAYELLQREAIEMRRITLLGAGFVSLCLTQQGIRPEVEEIYEEPIFETKGLLKKREVQVGMRPQVAVEGWQLNPKFAHNYGGQLILTTDQNINSHPPLVWHEKFRHITKASIKPLSRLPLSHDDMPWPRPRLDSRSFNLMDLLSDEDNYQMIQAEVDPSYLEKLQRAIDGGSADFDADDPHIDFYEDADPYVRLLLLENRKADYKLYKEARIEKKLRKAIAELAAKYNVLGPT